MFMIYWQIGVFFMDTVKFNYEGEMIDGKPHGKGIGSWDSGDRYEGCWRDGRQQGKGIYYYGGGGHYDGYWRDGNKHGKGILDFEDGDYKDGKWENDHFLSGVAKLTYEEGYELSYEGTFRSSGYYMGKLCYRDGDRYEGRFATGHRGGGWSEGTIYYANGSRLEGKWSESGDRGTIYYPNGARFTSNNLNRDKPSGIFYDLDGMEQKVVFKDGRFFLNGLWYYIEEGNCSSQNRHDKSSIGIIPDVCKEIICYLSDIGFIIYCWYWDRDSHKRKFKITSKDEAVHLIQKNDGLLGICLTLTSINIAEGESIPGRLWMEDEIIQIAHMKMSYATQFFNKKGEIINKSEEFTQKTLQFEEWFNDKFKNDCKKGENKNERSNKLHGRCR
jgi:hypothetical protein